ncbi:MAG: hypothetical protein H0V04_02535 [Chloroflexi bacterium]|nr:hypothetical protein [Chloroflexota bacterium]
MRLVEIRLLDGPNVYRLEPAVKLEVVVGRRRTWYGQRTPGRHASVRLGAVVAARTAPASVRVLAAWVRRLHALSGAAGWLADEGRAVTATRARISVTIHRTSEPGHWIVSYPWREKERAEAIAESALRLVELDIDPRRARPTARRRGSRSLARALARIAAAGTSPPEWLRDADRRVPAISISGTNGKSTTTRMITHILRVAGRRVGTTTSDGVLIDEQLVEEGDLTGPMGAHRVLRDPSIDVAVLETARGGIVLRGVGYETNEVSVLTNVSADHLDLHGLHTVPELAEVKAVIARMTRQDGVAVLNADDPLVAAVARTVRARVCFFSLSKGNRRIRRHTARAGLALVLDGDRLVELEGERRRDIVGVGDVPATLGGIARHNIANALAAAAAARAMGVSLRDVAAGLRDFRPTADQAPGRLNLYRIGEKLVVVDFAHNEAGLDVLLTVAEGLVGRKGRRTVPVVSIVGTAGDRPDDSLRAMGRMAAQRSDEVAIKETIRYLRGRTRESVVGELRAGLMSGGARPSEIPVWDDEPEALRGELTSAGRIAGSDGPAVVLLLCHADREGVARVLADLGADPLEASELPTIRKTFSANGA